MMAEQVIIGKTLKDLERVDTLNGNDTFLVCRGNTTKYVSKQVMFDTILGYVSSDARFKALSASIEKALITSMDDILAMQESDPSQLTSAIATPKPVLEVWNKAISAF